MSIWIWALHFDIFSWWLTKRERQRTTRKKEKQRKFFKWWRDVEMSRLHATHLAKAMTQNHLRFDSRFDLKKRHEFLFFPTNFGCQQKGNNTRKLFVNMLASKLFCRPAVKRVAAHSKPHANASAQTLSPIPRIQHDSTIQPMLQQNPSESLRICPSLSRRSSNQATQSSSHGHVPNRTWSYLANLHWKTIFGIMKHLHSLHPYPMYPDSIIFYHLYHVTYLVSSFPLAALARLRQTSSDL